MTKAQASNKKTKRDTKGTLFVWNKRYAYILVAGVLFVFGIWWFLLGGSVLGIRLGMQSYLEDKYGKAFIVEKPRLTDSGLGVSGMWRATAYPEDDSSLRFEVNLPQNNGKYGDRYTGAIWTREQKQVVKAFLDTIFPSTPRFEVDVHTTNVGPDAIRGDVPDFNSASQKFGDDIMYDITVKLESPELSETDKQYHRNQVAKIATYVQQKGVSSPGVRYVINIQGEDAGYICDLFRDTLTDSDKLNECFEQNTQGKVW